MTMRVLFLVGALISGAGARAETVRDSVEVRPAIGEVATASIGSPIYQSLTKATAWKTGAHLRSDLDLTLSNGNRVALPATATLVEHIYSSPGSFIACAKDGGYHTKRGVRLACFADSDGDGSFDRAGGDGSINRKKVDPIPYTKTEVPDRIVKTFRQGLLFSGLDGRTLRLSYREFSDDMARPAFTQDLALTMSGKYPETVSVRDVVITVHGIDNSGIRYTISRP